VDNGISYFLPFSDGQLGGSPLYYWRMWTAGGSYIGKMDQLQMSDGDVRAPSLEEVVAFMETGIRFIRTPLRTPLRTL
tara:strand:+ start:122 stop:355 length:234 start_codon:yes stop_codon:yes gene_type:complete